jgi:uncharacterized protein (TIGR02268 family)
VPLASLAPLLASAFLAISPEAAEPPRSDECEGASPRVVLGARPSDRVPVVCIGSRLSTTFRFNSRILPESLEVQERERFEDIAVGPRSFTVIPPEHLAPGKRFEVEVCFADGEAPACASFMLVEHPGLAMQQVDVFRQTRPVAYYEQVAEEAQAEVRQCREEVRQLRGQLGVPEGLTGAIASGLVGVGGVPYKDLTERVVWQKESALVAKEVSGYRAQGRVAVVVALENPGAEPWNVAGAVLRGLKGDVLKPLFMWQPEPIPLGPRLGRVVVEVLATEKEARGTYTLTLWDANRTRTVSLGNVTFP